jgi:hypothetical protein
MLEVGWPEPALVLERIASTRNWPASSAAVSRSVVLRRMVGLLFRVGVVAGNVAVDMAGELVGGRDDVVSETIPAVQRVRQCVEQTGDAQHRVRSRIVRAARRPPAQLRGGGPPERSPFLAIHSPPPPFGLRLHGIPRRAPADTGTLQLAVEGNVVDRQGDTSVDGIHLWAEGRYGRHRAALSDWPACLWRGAQVRPVGATAD